MVDLRPHQTGVRSQGLRGSCYIHGTVAAMEAAYKRAGYGDLDLAEHFSDYVARLMFLETCEFDGPFRTRTMRNPTAWERESGMPIFETMSGTVDSLVGCEPVGTLAIPLEVYMPLTEAMFDSAGRSQTDLYWVKQYNVSTHLLAETRLPRSALQAPFVYKVKRVEYLPKSDAQNPSAIERVLASGKEVIWDFRTAGDFSGPIWRYNGPAGDATAHRMLIVGYDRRDPSNPFFIVKNSWGHPAANPPGDDFTYIAYDYLQYGEWASWLEVEPPAIKPELAFVGRWQVEFGPNHGTLDIYHLPGLMQQLFDHNQYQDEHGRTIKDQRIGTFYRHGDPDQPFRVNGILHGDRLQAWIDFQNPTPRWDQLNGWRVELKLTIPAETMFGNAILPTGEGYSARAERIIIHSEPTPSATPPDVVVSTPSSPVESPRPALDADPALAPKQIEAKWLESGGQDFLGKPITGVETCPDGRGRYTHYERGSIYWSPRTPASIIYGAIRERWSDMGWETSDLGYPTSDEVDWGEGRMNTFENGHIFWHPDKGAWEELAKSAKAKMDVAQ
ncbi:MAG: hypothetical protein JNL67_22625 [Planctomycetaceae bacterium]|nr:hypothetical protein [Planctomycetaceae bacterium]